MKLFAKSSPFLREIKAIDKVDTVIIFNPANGGIYFSETSDDIELDTIGSLTSGIVSAASLSTNESDTPVQWIYFGSETQRTALLRINDAFFMMFSGKSDFMPGLIKYKIELFMEDILKDIKEFETNKNTASFNDGELENQIDAMWGDK